MDLIDGVGWSTDVVEWILEMVLKGLGEKNAPGVYQELVGSVLLREGGILMDVRSSTSFPTPSFLPFCFRCASLTTSDDMIDENSGRRSEEWRTEIHSTSVDGNSFRARIRQSRVLGSQGDF